VKPLWINLKALRRGVEPRNTRLELIVAGSASLFSFPALQIRWRQ
jgi:hypothetical protein